MTDALTEMTVLAEQLQWAIEHADIVKLQRDLVKAQGNWFYRRLPDGTPKWLAA